MKKNRVFYHFILMTFLVLGCGREELESDFEIYFNDFENGNLPSIEGGRILIFNNSRVIGNYNNDGFRLTLTGIPDHDYLTVSFDLLIHDTWDGNTNGFEEDFPDLWVMEFNKDIVLNRTSNPKFETTFSNTPCDSQLCLWQSFPESYPFLSGPQNGRAGAAPGLCLWADRTNGTSVYRIVKTFRHDDVAVIIDFYDRLYQPNALSASCDESWSMDNLMVRALTTN